MPPMLNRRFSPPLRRSVMTLVTLAALSEVAATRGDDVESALSRRLLAEGQVADEIRAFILERVPPLPAAASREDCLQQLATLRRAVLDDVVFRGWPRELRDHEPAVRWKEVIQKEGWSYRIRKLLYEPYPALWIPALLYEPLDVDGKVPAVLHPNGHVGQPGKSVDYKQRRSIDLARRGMLVLNPEWFGMGELAGPGHAHNQLALLDLCGRSGVGLFYLHLRAALDVLLAHPAADPERLAVSGLSGGGWQTILIAALDERVKACAPNAGYIGVSTRVLHPSDIGDLEQNPADLCSVADYTHLTAMLLPRPALLIYNENDDCCFPAARARASVYEPIRPLYDRYAAAAEFSFHENYFPGTHNYDLDNRLALYRFLNRSFLPPPARVDHELSGADEVLSFEELTVGLPEDNATFQSIARRLAERLPGTSAGDLERSREARDALRRRLRDVLRLEPTGVVAARSRAADGVWEHLLELTTGWTVPLLDFEPAATSGEPEVALLVADGPRSALAESVRELRRQSHRVLVADLLFAGEAQPPGNGHWQLAMLIGTVGKRPLGEKVAQLLAVGRWARARSGAPVAVHASGPVSSVTALLAGALDAERGVANETPRALSTVRVDSSLPSLKQLIRADVPYARLPSLFCWGLLEVCDVEHLLALAGR